jgi:hypothetical protein
MPLPRSSASLLALPVLLAACDSPSDVRVEGSYTLNVTGEGVSESLQGTAFYGTDSSEDGQEYFGILFGDSDEGDASQIDPEDGTFGAFIRQGGGTPGPGSYTIGDVATSELDSGDFFLVVTTQDDGYVYVSRGGSLTITETLADAIEGTFTVPGVRVQEGSQTVTEVTLSGSFLAASPENPGAGFLDPFAFGVYFGRPPF